MSAELMQKAKKLILAHRYDEARKLLHTVNSQEAAKWLAKLNEIAPPTTPPLKAETSIEDLFKQAKRLMKNSQFDEARDILQKIDHPMATQWLAKLNQIAPPPPSAPHKSSKVPSSNEGTSPDEGTSPEKLLAEAKSLMQARQFDKARHILETLKHPTAALWLLKLNEIAPPPPAFDFTPDEPTSETSAFDFIPDETASEPPAFDFIPDEPASETSTFDFIPGETASEPPAFDFIPDETASEPPAFGFGFDESPSETVEEPDFDFSFDEEPSNTDFAFGSDDEMPQLSFDSKNEEPMLETVLAVADESDRLPMPSIEDVLGESYQANLAIVSEEPVFEPPTTSVGNLSDYEQTNVSVKNSGHAITKNSTMLQLTNKDGTFNKGKMMALLGFMGVLFGSCAGFFLDMMLSTLIFCCSLSFFGLIAGVGLGYLADWDTLFATWNRYKEDPEEFIDDVAEAFEDDGDDDYDHDDYDHDDYDDYE